MSITTITFLGAAGSVTGSSTLLQLGASSFLIDHGSSQEETRQNTPIKNIDKSSVNALVLTHGHMDHSGEVPNLYRKGFNGPCICHPATLDIAKCIWADSLKIGEQSGTNPFEAADVLKTVQNARTTGYGIPLQIGDVTITFFDAGHILGSSHVLFEYKGKRILFSGDIGKTGTPIIRDPFTNWKDPVDTIVIESTYGNRNHKSHESTLKEFEQIIHKAIREKGVVLIPSFAIGRTQEMLYHLNTLVESRIVPKLPVFVDSPMAQVVTSLYRRYRDCYDSEAIQKFTSGDAPLAFDGLHMVESSEESNAIKNVKPPFIIIAGSGMCNGGRILNHIAEFGKFENTTIMFVGFQGKGTLGRKLIEGERKLLINNSEIDIRAKIETLNGFSAHADQTGLLTWAKNIPGENKEWFVNHGESDASMCLAELINKNGLGVASVARLGGGMTR